MSKGRLSSPTACASDCIEVNQILGSVGLGLYSPRNGKHALTNEVLREDSNDDGFHELLISLNNTSDSCQKVMLEVMAAANSSEIRLCHDTGNSLAILARACFSYRREDFIGLVWKPALRNFARATNGFRGTRLTFMLESLLW